MGNIFSAEGGLHRRHVEVADGGPGDAVLASGEGSVHHPLLLQVDGALDHAVVERELPRHTAVQPRLEECLELVQCDVTHVWRLISHNQIKCPGWSPLPSKPTYDLRPPPPPPPLLPHTLEFEPQYIRQSFPNPS